MAKPKAKVKIPSQKPIIKNNSSSIADVSAIVSSNLGANLGVNTDESETDQFDGMERLDTDKYMRKHKSHFSMQEYGVDLLELSDDELEELNRKRANDDNDLATINNDDNNESKSNPPSPINTGITSNNNKRKVPKKKAPKKPTNDDSKSAYNKYTNNNNTLTPVLTPSTPNSDDPSRASFFLSRVRSVVSKKKKRYVDEINGINLDLTYITKNIIAMGFPTQGKERYYRNPLDQVQKFFKLNHAGKFKVYNLCGERKRKYNHNIFTNSPLNGKVAEYGFSDHNVCELSMILQFCIDVKEFLNSDIDNVAAIHCKAGKGRTGMMIASYLLYSKVKSLSSKALDLFAEQRTENRKGVTIPSQRRFVQYFGGYVLKDKTFDFNRKCILKKVIINTVPNFDYGGGCDPYFQILNTKGKEIYNYKKRGFRVENFQKQKGNNKKNVRIFENFKCPVLQGSFKIVFWDEDYGSADDIMCWAWFNASVCAHEQKIILEKDEIDNAHKDKKDKHFESDFQLGFVFEPYNNKIKNKINNNQ